MNGGETVANSATIAKIKTDLRITHSVLDSELSDQIDSCLADLRMCGIGEPYEDDPLVLNCLKLWCRANYTTETGPADAYMNRYNALKSSLMMASGYGGGSREN